MRFINAKRSTPQQEIIAKLSEENKLIASGSAKGYEVENYSWVADYSFKFPSNNFINPHTGYISFFSDREIFDQEFGNVVRITDAYNFFESIIRKQLSSHSFELTRKQYSMVSSKGNEYDTIEYLNISAKEKILTTSSVIEYSYEHEFGRAPAFNISGYIANLDHANPGIKLGQAQYYDRYYWAYQWDISNNVDINNVAVNIKPYTEDLSGDNDTDEEIIGSESHINPGSSNIRRLLDVKINISNTKVFHFKDKSEWVYYYNDTVHYYNQSYNPYYGIANFYDEDWNEIHPLNNGMFNQSLLFFPSIIRNGVLEPAKIIASWGNNHRGTPYNVSGNMAFNNGVTLSEPDDQSRIVYNVCRHMINKPDAVEEPFNTARYLIHKKVDSNYLYCGIDIDTERNRRYSSVVMTEPYFVTEPVGNGEIVNYMFVDSEGSPIIFNGNESEFLNKPEMFLKIKATKNIIDEIDRLIKLTDTNNDIIEVLTIIDPVLKRGYLPSGPDYYDDFGSSDDDFFKRQDDCVDDLIGKEAGYLGIVGQGKHKVYTINPEIISFDPTKYSAIPGQANDTMKVCGLGFTSKINNPGEGVTNYLNIYCTNYHPTNAPAPGEFSPIPNDIIEFIDPSTINFSVKNEKFYPMIKLSGINGYIKILERNTTFKLTRASDGGYEVVYNVEFPYCPGSYSERVAMNFDDYKETLILKKLSYIPAGSWEASLVGSNQSTTTTPSPDVEKRYDVYNRRHAPFADDSFCSHSVLTQKSASGSIKTAPFGTGGGIFEVSQTQNDLVEYPSSLVWEFNIFNLLSLTKPRLNKPAEEYSQYPEFRKYGTYDVRVQEDSISNVYSKDLKLIGLVDNRKWKFSDNKFISYIDRENPSYVCCIDTSALFNDLTRYQKDNAALPDMKRWLYSMFSGFSYSILDVDKSSIDEDLPVTENVNTILNNDLPTVDSKSDIIIEIWDRYSLNGNWRPVSPINSDTYKVAGKSLLDNVYIKSGSLESYFPSEFIWTVNLGYLDSNGIIDFPDFVNFGQQGDIISGKSNLVLFDRVSNKTYHIAYIGVSESFYKAYIYYDPSEGILPTFNINNLEIGASGPFSICLTKNQMNKNISFRLYTSRVVQGVYNNLITRYIDIRTNGTSSDLARFIDENRKLYFRIRVVKDKNYKISYENNDESKIQYLWDTHTENIGANLWVNFPWATYTYPGPEVYDQAFDWKKVFTTEITRKFGMRYFKCASK